jgi:hypothetical protein
VAIPKNTTTEFTIVITVMQKHTMKNVYLLSLLFLSAVICLSPSCKKHDDNIDPLSQLPPATQTGANTSGCLVNGQAYLTSGSTFGGPIKQCNYIYLNGGYNFFVEGYAKESSKSTGLYIRTDSLAISEGQTFVFKTWTHGYASAGYDVAYSPSGYDSYTTNNSVSGQLHITKFDQTKQIISGTFFFNAVNSKGDTVHVTDGRFDMKYTQ